ncbi:MAG: zinc-binding dehydrogenase [Planctomycetota bacterium]|nr:zinc-binding dehydrogenase [Planctomycetota bacterium]
MNGQQLMMTGPNRVELREVEMDDALAHGETLLKITHSLISPGTELSVMAGVKEGQARGTGYTAVGSIIADGGGIDPAIKGRPVFLFPAYTDQRNCHASHKKCERDGIYLPLPDGLDPAKACFARMINVVLTPFAHLDSRVQGWALVTGLGLVGNLAAQVARIKGFAVIGVDQDAARRKRATDVGVHHVIDSHVGDTVEQVKALTGGRGAMLSINATGYAATFMASIAATADGGEFSSLGGARGETLVDLVELFRHVQNRHVTIRGGWEMLLPRQPSPANRTPSTAENLALALRWLRDDTIDLKPLWTHTVKAKDAPEAYAALRQADPAYLGVVVDWT